MDTQCLVSAVEKMFKVYLAKYINVFNKNKYNIFSENNPFLLLHVL